MNIEQVRNNIRNTLTQKKRNIEEASKRRNSKWNRYYQSRQWKALRAYYMAEHPLCENCEHFGRAVPATELHHLSIFGAAPTEQERWRLLLADWNVRALCSHCHDLYHDEMRRNHITEYRGYIQPDILTEY